jgi:hypothetical protein
MTMNNPGNRPSTLDLDYGTDGLPLLDSPWSVRFAQGTRGRTALEVYNLGVLLDVLVAQPLAGDVLRGARRAQHNGRASVLAWGHLPPGGEPPAVTFSQRHRLAGRAETVVAAGEFWIATVEGCFDRVTASTADGSVRSERIRAGWSR